MLYYYGTSRIGLGLHTHLGILVGFIIGVRYSFGIVRLGRVQHSLSVLEQNITKTVCDTVLYIDKVQICEEIKAMLLTYVGLKFSALDKDFVLENQVVDLYRKSPDIIPSLVLRKMKKNLESVYMQGRCVNHFNRIENELLELQAIKDSRASDVGRVIFNWCNLVYSLFIGGSMVNELSYGVIPITFILSFLFFSMNKMMNDFEAPFSKTIKLQSYYSKLKQISAGESQKESTTVSSEVDHDIEEGNNSTFSVNDGPIDVVIAD